MELPLIEHELARLGRRKSTYAMRAAPVIVAFLAMLLNMVIVATFRSSGPYSVVMSDVDYDFQFAGQLQISIVVLLAPVLAAIAIAREKQDRTLGLLTLAEIRSTDIYIAKLAGVFLSVGSLVLILVPISVLGIVLEGVTLGQFLLQLAGMVLILVQVSVLGLFCSTISSRAADAVIMTYAILLGWLLVVRNLFPLGSDLFPDWPILAWVTGTGLPLFGSLVFIAGFAYWTIRLLERLGEDRAVGRRRVRRKSRSRSTKHELAAVYRGAAQSCGSAWLSPPRHWFVAAAALLISIVVQWNLGAWFYWLVLFILAYDVISTVEGCERQGTLDEIGCTPSSDRTLARAAIRVHFMRGLVFLPALMVTSIAGLTDPIPGFAVSFDTPKGIAIVVAAQLNAAAGIVANLLLIAAISSYVAAHDGGTPRRLVFVALHYFLVSFLTGMGIVAIVISGGVLGGSANPYPTMVAVSIASVVVSSLFAYVYYIRFAERIARRWRNGGSTRLVVNPQVSGAWHSH